MSSSSSSSSIRPDAIPSSGPVVVVKDEFIADVDDHRHFVPHPVGSSSDDVDCRDGAGGMHRDDDDDDDDDDDPVIRTIDVYISPSLSSTIRLIQFPIEPAHGRHRYRRIANGHEKGDDDGHRPPPPPPAPIEARYRPRHDMLELDYPLPNYDRDRRQLSDNLCLSTRTNVSTAIVPGTHMALARLGGGGAEGNRLDVIPLRRSVMQMRPSFGHLHNGEDDEDDAANNGRGRDGDNNGGDDDDGGQQRPIMFARKETERSVNARKNSYAHQRASEALEEWIQLDVHGAIAHAGGGNRQMHSSVVRRETLSRVKCSDLDNALRLAGFADDAAADDDDEMPRAMMDDRGARYVRSLNYLDAYSTGRGGAAGDASVDNLSEWTPSNAAARGNGRRGRDDDDNIMTDATDDPDFLFGPNDDMAIAELAAKLALLMQNGQGTMIPYCVIRSRFHPANVPDDMLAAALSSCAVLVRGNFALKSTLTKFLSPAAAGGGGGGGGVDGRNKVRLLRELRDLILLLLNMHGMVQRERLARAYSSRNGGGRGGDEGRRNAGGGIYDPIINPDMITFVLRTVARKSDDCWIAKVDDDEGFAAAFPEVAACHAIYWMKKREMMADLIELYESVEGGNMEC
jgi:DNA-directed RNA polymerase-3 subunit RPC5